MIKEICCETCKLNKPKCILDKPEKECLHNPVRGKVVRVWWDKIPRLFDEYYYARWQPKTDNILPDSLFEI